MQTSDNVRKWIDPSRSASEHRTWWFEGDEYFVGLPALPVRAPAVLREVCARVKYYYMDEGKKVVYQHSGTQFASTANVLMEAQGINKIPIKPSKSLCRYDRICKRRKVGTGASESGCS